MVVLTLILTKYALIHSFTSPNLTNFQFTLLSFSIVLITASGYVINDIFDVKADKINKPDNVFIDVIITKKNALQIYFMLTVLGILLGIYVSFTIHQSVYSFIFVGTSIGLYVYSYTLKKLPLIGNIFVSILIGLSIFTIYLFEFTNKSSSLYYTILVYISFSFATTLVREILKDIEDINGDNHLKMKTLPILIGKKRTKNIIIIFTSFLFIFTIVVTKYLYKSSSPFFYYAIVFTLLPLSYFLFKLWNATTTKQFHFLSSLMKIIMLFGILSMLIFKFI